MTDENEIFATVMSAIDQEIKGITFALDQAMYSLDPPSDDGWVPLTPTYVATSTTSGILTFPLPSPDCPCSGCDRLTVDPEIQAIRDAIPGFESATTIDPCGLTDCMLNGTSCSLAFAIVHLNDEAEWTREKIADWLDTLDVDLKFKVASDDQL